MRRAQYDCGSQPFRNLYGNPSFETAGASFNAFTNLAQNPSFETTSGAVYTRTNLATNPTFEAVSGYTDVRTNLTLNPSFEGTSGVTNVLTNLITNPSFEYTGSVANIRTNLCVNPRGVNAYADYNGASNQTITANVAVTGNPDGITTANRIAYDGGSNPGVTLYTGVEASTTYTISAWVFHETLAPTPGAGALAQASVTSDTNRPDPVQGVWQKHVWTRTTTTSTSHFGFRVSGQTGAGSFLITGVVVEKASAAGSFFDGATKTTTNIVKYPTMGLGTGGSATLTSNVSYSGSTWQRAATVAGTGSANARMAVDLADIQPGGKTFTVSVTVANDQAFSQIVVLDWCDTNATTFNLAPGEVRRIKTTGSRPSYDSTYRFADLQINQSATEGRSILFKDWLIEEGTTDGYYYPTTGDFTYAWAGTANNSVSYQRATNLSVWYATTTGITYSTVLDPVVGTKAAAVKTVGASGDGITFADITTTVGRAYTFSAWIKTTAVHRMDGVIRWKDSAGAIVGTDTTSELSASLTIGKWTRLSITGTAPAGSVKMQPMWRIYAAHTPTTFYVGGALVVESGIDVPYFDGSTAASGDFTYAWAGTAHQSVSYQQAPTLTYWSNRWFGNGGGAGALYQAKGGLSGTYARKVWNQANTTGAMDTGIASTNPVAVSASMPYTLSAWVRSSVAQSFHFSIEWRDAGNTVISTSREASHVSVTANTWTRVSVTGTSPSNASVAYPMVTTYNNSQPMPAGSTMDFDSVLFESAPIVRDYFDGSNPIQNLCTNPSFETNTSGWGNGPNVSIAQTSVRAHSGTKSLLWTRSNTTSGSGYITMPLGSAVAGYTYSASAYIYGGVGNYQIFLNNNTNSQSISTPKTVFSASASSWTRVSFTFTATTNFSNLTLFITDDNNTSPTSGSTLYIDSVLVEKSATINPYYEGTGDFSYYWNGTVNGSVSVQRADKPANVGSTWQGLVYKSGVPGHYKARIFYHSNSVLDSGINFSGNISLAASKTYTVSVLLTSDVARTIRFSAQGTGAVNSTTTPIALSAGVPTRLSWTFSTTATAPTGTALYILRGEASIMGILDVEDMIVEEGSIINGKYFDGTKTEQNLIANSNFEADASGWWPNTGSPTLSASTDRAYLGTKSLKAVSTLTSSDIAVTISATLNPLTTYTISYYVYTPEARTNCYIDISAVNFQMMQRGLKSVAAGVWTRMSTTFTTSANISGPTAFYLHNAGGPSAIGSTVYFDCVLLEESDTLNQYYEGSGDFTYAWTGTAHASTSVQQGVSVSRTSSARAFGVSTTRNGDKVVRVIPSAKGNGGGYTPYTGSDVFIDLSGQVPALKPNTTYTIVSTIVLEAPLSAGIAKWRINIDNIDQSSPVFPNTVGEHTQKWQFTTGANATILFIRFMPGPSGAAGFTNEVILKNVMIVEGPYSGEYFDGTTPAATDYTYQWSGTAHNSTSYKRATWIASTSSGNCHATLSSEWSASGTKSLRLTPNTTSSASSGILQFVPIVPGRTYTMLATRRLSAPLTGTLSSYAGTVFFVQTGFPTQFSNVLPNVAGVGVARLKFKMDPNVTTWTLRVGHGGAEGSGDVWWDNLMVVEGDYDGDYIDGSKPLAKWDGAANASTSIGYPPQFLEVAGKPTREQIGVGVLANTNPAPDFGPRTLYHVFESKGYTAAYQSSGYYGVFGQGGRIAMQTQAANQNNVAIRVDFASGEANRVLVMQTGTRNPGIHVIATTIEDGCTVARTCCDGGADVVGTGMNPGTGWGSDQMAVNPAYSETVGIRTIIFNAQHDRATRLAISRYLGNKYGANVA